MANRLSIHAPRPHTSSDDLLTFYSLSFKFHQNQLSGYRDGVKVGLIYYFGQWPIQCLILAAAILNFTGSRPSNARHKFLNFLDFVDKTAVDFVNLVPVLEYYKVTQTEHGCWQVVMFCRNKTKLYTFNRPVKLTARSRDQ